MSQQTRQGALRALLNFERPLHAVRADLAPFPFESNDPPLPLTRAHLEHALNLYLANEITAPDLEEWANLLEVRDDLQVYDADNDLLADIIFNLANPTLQGEITHKSCRAALTRLRT